MKTLLKHILTGKDNQTYDLVRVGILVSLLAFFGVTIGEIIKNHSINLLDFAGGSTMILGGGSAGLKVKETTEPNQQ